MSARAKAAARVALASAGLQLRLQWSPAIVVLAIVQPAAFLAITVLAARGHRHVDLAAAALGLSLVGLWGTTVWQAGNILRFERFQGTLGTIAAQPAGLATILTGKSLGATLRSIAFIVPTVALASVAAGHPIPVRDPLWFAAAAIAAVLSAAVVGMLLSCLFLLTRAATRIAEALTYPVFILGGLVVPLSLLPSWVRPFSTVVSLRWSGELLRAASAGRSQEPRAWLLLLGTTAVYAAVTAALFGRVVRRSRQEGTLDFV